MIHIALSSFILAISGLKVPDITGTTPPEIDCPNKLCHGKADGNYNIYGYPSYFVQCLGGLAYCQACWPLSLQFSETCNQCLYNKKDACVTTEAWKPATTYYCPDKCPHYGPEYSGNVADPQNKRQYVACWKGVTVGCVACPGTLEFNQEWNACLYQGKYKTAPDSSSH